MNRIRDDDDDKFFFTYQKKRIRDDSTPFGFFPPTNPQPNLHPHHHNTR